MCDKGHTNHQKQASSYPNKRQWMSNCWTTYFGGLKQMKVVSFSWILSTLGVKKKNQSPNTYLTPSLSMHFFYWNPPISMISVHLILMLMLWPIGECRIFPNCQISHIWVNNHYVWRNIDCLIYFFKLQFLLPINKFHWFFPCGAQHSAFYQSCTKSSSGKKACKRLYSHA